MAITQIIKKPQRWDLPFSSELPNPAERDELSDVDLDRLLLIEPFVRMAPSAFPAHLPLRGILRNDTRIRRYRHGDVVIRQGDYGNSAFLILTGAVRVIVKGLAPKLIGRRARQRKSWIKSIAQLVTNPRSPEVRDPRRYPRQASGAVNAQHDPDARVFVQDVTNVLSGFPDAFEKTRNNQMGPGELFGELAALGRLQRTATVVADGEAELLEIRWQGLRDLRKYDEAMRDHVDRQFRAFGLSATLRACPLLATISEDAIKELSQHAEFESYGSYDWFGSYQQLRKKRGDPLADEPIIARQGDYAEGLILIRAGFARLSRKHGNGEQTFGYLGKGDIYGWHELVHNAQSSTAMPLAATLRAIGYVDVVRIPTRTFERLVRPGISGEWLADFRSDTHAANDAPANIALPIISHANRSAAPPGTQSINPGMMEFLVEHRFINGTATMMIDMDRCTRCDECVRACASGHENNPRFVRHGPIFDRFMVANACMHCADPVCMIGCPTGAIHRTKEGGQIVINDITCIGCGTCASSCPYDNIRMVEVRNQLDDDAIMIDPEHGRPIVKATKCDLCVDHHGGPACQRACPHDALKRVDMHNLEGLAEWLNR